MDDVERLLVGEAAAFDKVGLHAESVKTLVKIQEEYYLARLIPNAMEPRGVVVDPNVAMGEYVVYTSTQIPHILRTTLTAEGRRIVTRCESAVAAMEEEMLISFDSDARERLIHELAICVHALGAGLRADVAWFSFIERTVVRIDVAKTVNAATPC